MRVSARAALAICSACCALLIVSGSASATVTRVTPDFAGTYAPVIGSLAIDPAANGAAGNVITSDHVNFAGSAPEMFSSTPDGQTRGGPYVPFYGGSGGEINTLGGMSLDPVNHQLFVSDTQGNRVMRFDPSDFSTTTDFNANLIKHCDGSFVTCPSSSLPGEFDRPTESAFVNGKLYVIDYGNSRIEVFTPDLTYLFAFTYVDWDTDTRYPTGIDVDPLTGHIFVSNNQPDQIDEFDGVGNFVKTFGSLDSDGGYIRHIAIDPVTHLIYASAGIRVAIYDSLTGDYVSEFNTDSSGDVAVDPVNRTIYLAYTGAVPSVYRYSFSPAPVCSELSTTTVGIGGSVSLALSCTDADAGPDVFYEPLSQPAHGTLSNFNGDSGAFSYSANPGYAGPDSFTYRGYSVNGSSVKTVSFNVAAAPPTPTVSSKPVPQVSSNISPATGDVLIKVPGTNDFVPLTKDTLIPLGTIVDARVGTCVITFAKPDGTTYSAKFWAGVFQISQTGGANPISDIKLRDDIAAKGGTATSSVFDGGLALIAKAKKKKKNGVWGDGKGRFRTTGSGSSSSVRGTRWFVQDDGVGTLTKVTRGLVAVKNFATKKTVQVKAGQSYFAPNKAKKKAKKKK
jgi:hypothetical protein